MTKRIVVGPHAMYVECHGIRTKEVQLTDSDTPEIVLQKACDLWETIRPLVSWAVWTRHRLKMAMQRRMARLIAANWPGPYFAGPRPNLISTKPWKQAAQGEWMSLPPGVAYRLLRGSQ